MKWIKNKDKRILQDIDRLSALSFYIRHGKIRLIKEEKWYFQCVDDNINIRDVLKNCEVIK